MNLYSHADWRRFREDVIKLDGGCCTRCRRGPNEDAVLQVHHKAYVRGRAPWQYPYTECETLCKGCHAAEHGIIMPQTGWELFGSDDLGDLVGSCELCGTELRYVYAIAHPQWSALAVGTDCCDKLTGNTIASEYHENYLKMCDKRKRFVDSPKWKSDLRGGFYIKRDGINIKIRLLDGVYRISLDEANGKIDYKSVLDAKISAFRLIDSGDAAIYLEDRRLRKNLRKIDGNK